MKNERNFFWAQLWSLVIQQSLPVSSLFQSQMNQILHQASLSPLYHDCVNAYSQREKVVKSGIADTFRSQRSNLQEQAKKLGYKEGDFPIAELQSKRILSLPIYPELTDEQINIVTEEIKNFYSHNN